jgi:hypothetical protein
MQTTGPTTDPTADGAVVASRAGGLAYDAAGRLLIDVRGPRFGAVITSLVLATALLVQGGIGLALVAWQWTMFAIAAGAGLRYSVYGNLFRFVKRRLDLGPPPQTEPEAGPRFAQACGLAVLTVALAAFALDALVVAWTSVGVVLALSLLLASTNVCIGCLLYGVISRLPAPLGAARR